MKSERGRVVVINPNSNRAVTELFSAELEPLRFADGPEIVCQTLAEGPLGVESELNFEMVVEPHFTVICQGQSATVWHSPNRGRITMAPEPAIAFRAARRVIRAMDRIVGSRGVR